MLESLAALLLPLFIGAGLYMILGYFSTDGPIKKPKITPVPKSSSEQVPVPALVLPDAQDDEDFDVETLEEESSEN